MIWKPHTTVAAIVERDQHFLLVEEESEDRIVFSQPAGHLESDESLIDAVIRETREETAWHFHPESITGIYRWKQHEKNRTFIRTTFCGYCDNHKPEQKLDEGIIKAIWMTYDEIKENESRLRSPIVLKCIDDYLAGQRYSLNILRDL